MLLERLVVFFFFFKQKTAYEIRTVTGVQTCALPISALGAASRFTGSQGDREFHQSGVGDLRAILLPVVLQRLERSREELGFPVVRPNCFRHAIRDRKSVV